MKLQPSDHVQCPHCHASGVDTYKRACWVCDSKGEVTVSMREEYRNARKQVARSLDKLQARMF
jgi:ribosomal protein L37AE/L43A